MKVRIRYDKKDFTVPLGDGPVQITDGFGGWQLVDRPYDDSMTQWTGQGPIALSVPLLLDGFAEDRGVQKDFDKVLALGRGKDPDERPPVFKVTGPIPFSGRRFVMEGTPDMGQTILSKDGRLLRQALTVTLREYVPTDQVKIKRKRSSADGVPWTSDARTYTTRKNDTLVSIAARLRPHDSGKEQLKYAKELGERNGIRDVRKKLDAGTVLRLP